MSEVIQYKNYFEFDDKCYFHPGYYIEELIEYFGLSQAEFAFQMDTSEKTVSLLVNAKQSLTPDLASKLSRMTGQSTELWLGYQAQYDAAIAEIKSQESLESDKEILSSLEYQYFVKHFNAPAPDRSRDSWKEKVKWLRRTFNVASLNLLKVPDLSLKYRILGSELGEKNIICSNAMLLLAKAQFQIDKPSFDTKNFKKTVSILQTKLDQAAPDIADIKALLSECGVELVVLPNLKRSKIRGAMKKQGNRILLMVTDSRHSLDSFWFTLFHELGHIYNGDHISITVNKESYTKYDNEEAADSFARDHLIPSREYESFIAQRDFSLKAINEFSQKIKRIPGIVTGRLASDGYLDFKNDNALIAATKIDFYGTTKILDSENA